MVAKSYQSFIQESEPFLKNGKMYVNVRNPSTNHTQTVRFYTEEEYVKYYGKSSLPAKPSVNLKEALGFSNGFITIFKGDTYENKDWFKENAARYHKIFGWYFPSTEEIPSDIPCGVAAIKLLWAEVISSDGTLFSDNQLAAVIDNLIYDPTPSEYQGSIGERLTITAKVQKVVTYEGYYGKTYIHTFIDENENLYVWATASRKLEEGQTYTFKGTVKEHKVYRNSKETVLTRCKVLD